MPNGSNEPVEFTRGDAERLVAIEIQHKTTHRKLDVLTAKLAAFLIAHDDEHDKLEKQVAKNARFRRIVINALLWVFTTGTGVGLLAVGARAMGWLD